ISKRYARICDSPIAFNSEEFTVVWSRRLPFRIASTAATSLGEVPVPLNRRMLRVPLFTSRARQAIKALEIKTSQAKTKALHTDGVISFFCIFNFQICYPNAAFIHPADRHPLSRFCSDRRSSHHRPPN